MSNQVAHVILEQLGGAGKLMVMAGAKMPFVSLSEQRGGVQFSIGRNEKRVNKVKIVLNGSDLYDVEYWRIWGAKATLLSSSENIYGDMLMDDFESNTGMYLTLMPRR